LTVVDTTVLIDYLIEDEHRDGVDDLFASRLPVAAPDVVVFEVLSALRRMTFAGRLDDKRAGNAVVDLGDVQVDLFSSLPLRERAWELRHNLTAGDALFLALAEQLGESLATKDRGLLAAAREAGVETVDLAPAAE
jgi:predicted nucleic acid-binding protein